MERGLTLSAPLNLLVFGNNDLLWFINKCCKNSKHNTLNKTTNKPLKSKWIWKGIHPVGLICPNKRIEKSDVNTKLYSFHYTFVLIALNKNKGKEEGSNKFCKKSSPLGGFKNFHRSEKGLMFLALIGRSQYQSVNNKICNFINNKDYNKCNPEFLFVHGASCLFIKIWFVGDKLLCEANNWQKN